MKATGTIILFLITSCQFYKASCQPVYPKPFKTLTVADGLPQSFISGLVQDSTGFIWIATRNGLARYDGRKFKIFRHIPGDSTTLSDNIITSLYMDKQQQLWIFFEAGDVDILNTVTEALFHFTKSAAYKPLMALLKPLQSFAEDGKGNFWLLNADGSGIYSCNLSNQTLHFYSAAALGLPDHKIAGITSNGKNILLITNNSIVIIGDNKRISKTVPYLFTNTLEDLVFTWKTIPVIVRKNGETVIVNQGRLIIYNSSNNSVKTIPLSAEPNLLNFCITQDSKGQIFFDYGYNVYVLSSRNILSIWKPKEENPAYGFKSMLIDKSGVFWLGGNGSGIQSFDLRLPRLAGLPYKKNFHEDVLQNFLHVPQEEIQRTSLYNKRSYYIRWAKGLKNDIWFSRAGEGTINEAEVYHYADGHLTVPKWRYTDTSTSQHININGLALSDSGRLWGIDFNLRPVYLDTLTHSVTVYPPLDSVNKDYSFTVSSVLTDGEDKFWISTALNGLFFYNRQSNEVMHYAAGKSPGSLPTNQLMNIIQDPINKDVLWIGSLGGGLIRFNKSIGKCIFYTTKQGFPDNTVYAVIMDAKGILWCSSNKGIFSFNPETITIRSYTSKDGLAGDEFNRYHFLQLPDGRMVFGGVDGYTVFNPLTLANDNFQPTVALTGIRVNNTSADFGDAFSPFKQAVNSLHRINLPYDKNFLSFEFAALEYNIADKLQYRYMLENFDKDWVYAGNSNVASYTKLPPGNYTLKINATNTAGQWSNHIKTLPVIITPPFWQTWWFSSLMILVATTIASFLFQSRISYIRNQEREKMKFEREASDLKAQALRAQMNPHFIFNCLNSIKALIHEDNKRQAIIYLTTFSRLIRNQMNNAQQEISLHDELETCKIYADLEALRFGSNIICEFQVDEKVDTLSFLVPPLIIQPFIENAIWHGILPKEGGKVLVSVVSIDEDTVQCSIDDNGIGREVSMLNKLSQSATYESKGMKLVKNRLNLYNIINNSGGSVVVIDKKDANQNAAGTLIIITFNK